MNPPTQEDYLNWKKKRGESCDPEREAMYVWEFMSERLARNDVEVTAFKRLCCCAKYTHTVSKSCNSNPHDLCWSRIVESKGLSWKELKADIDEIYSTVEQFVANGNKFLLIPTGNRIKLVIEDIVREV